MFWTEGGGGGGGGRGGGGGGEGGGGDEGEEREEEEDQRRQRKGEEEAHLIGQVEFPENPIGQAEATTGVMDCQDGCHGNAVRGSGHSSF